MRKVTVRILSRTTVLLLLFEQPDRIQANTWHHNTR